MDANEQQLAFSEAFVANGGNGTQAAITAGYTAHSARQQSARLLTLPHVQEAIRREQGKTLRTRLAGKALGLLESILDDPAAPPGVRVDAAKTILDRAGLTALRTPTDEAGDTGPQLAMLSLAELEAVVRRTEMRLIAHRSGQVIDAEVVEVVQAERVPVVVA